MPEGVPLSVVDAEKPVTLKGVTRGEGGKKMAIVEYTATADGEKHHVELHPDSLVSTGGTQRLAIGDRVVVRGTHPCTYVPSGTEGTVLGGHDGVHVVVFDVNTGTDGTSLSDTVRLTQDSVRGSVLQFVSAGTDSSDDDSESSAPSSADTDSDTDDDAGFLDTLRGEVPVEVYEELIQVCSLGELDTLASRVRDVHTVGDALKFLHAPR